MNWAQAKPIVEAIPGFLVPGQEEWLFNKAKSLPNMAGAIEVGCWKGRSTAAIMLGLSCVNGILTVIDTDTRSASVNMINVGLRNNVHFHSGASVEALSRWASNYADMIFLDGSHTMPVILCDFANAYRILKPGGWLVMHDVGCDFPDVTKVWESLCFLLSDHEECSTIRAGRKTYKEHDTP